MNTSQDHIQGFIQDFSVGGGTFFFIAGETMWLIDQSEGEGDVLPPMLHAAQKLTV